MNGEGCSFALEELKYGGGGDGRGHVAVLGEGLGADVAGVEGQVAGSPGFQV